MPAFCCYVGQKPCGTLACRYPLYETEGRIIRKKPNRTKSTALSFYVSEWMSDMIHSRADESGLSLTAYLTACALGKEIVKIDGISEFAKALKSTGNNLNQLTILANMNRISAVDLSECRKLYSVIQKSLKEILERM